MPGRGDALVGRAMVERGAGPDRRLPALHLRAGRPRRARRRLAEGGLRRRARRLRPEVRRPTPSTSTACRSTSPAPTTRRRTSTRPASGPPSATARCGRSCRDDRGPPRRPFPRHGPQQRLGERPPARGLRGARPPPSSPRPRVSFFPSLKATLNHIYGVDLLLPRRAGGGRPRPAIFDTIPDFADPAALRAAQAASDAPADRLLRPADRTDLDRSVADRPRRRGHRARARRRAARAPLPAPDPPPRPGARHARRHRRRRRRSSTSSSSTTTATPRSPPWACCRDLPDLPGARRPPSPGTRSPSSAPARSA